MLTLCTVKESAWMPAFAGMTVLALSHRPPRPQGLCQSPLVEIIQLAADREAVSELGEADGIGLQPLGEVVGGGLALQRRVHGENDFVDAAPGDPGDQGVDAEI